jgi:hypothetical protein
MNKFSLENHPKIKSGFNAPEGYFENLASDVLEKINDTPPKKGRVVTLRSFGIAVAAILVLALSIPFFLNNDPFSEETIDTNTLENYLAYQSGVSAYDLIHLMEVSELDAMQVDLALEDESVENILTNNPNLENYLID